jgi:peroxiredoxin
VLRSGDAIIDRVNLSDPNTSDEIFKGKTVVVFSLPGAFTPTCSSTHVPRYNQLVPAFRQHGVDDVVCISVNDAFVMNEWRSEQKAFNVTFVSDGNGDFSRGMGATIRAVSGASTVPQVFINGDHIGGSEALEAYLSEPKAA